MKSEEAIQKIHEISNLLKSSNQGLFSGRQMMVSGALVVLAPVFATLLEIALRYFEISARTRSLIATAATVIVFLALGSYSSKKVRTLPTTRPPLHPLITKAFEVTRPTILAVVGIVFVLGWTGRGDLIYPFVLILIGLMFSVFGKFSIRAVTYIAWSYIALGLLFFYLLQFKIPYLALYFLGYNGISYFVMGYFLEKASHQNEFRY